MVKNCTKWEPLLKDVNVNSNRVLNDQMKRPNFDQVGNFPRINLKTAQWNLNAESKGIQNQKSWCQRTTGGRKYLCSKGGGQHRNKIP